MSLKFIFNYYLDIFYLEGLGSRE